MVRKVPYRRLNWRQRLVRWARNTGDTAILTRAQIVAFAAEGMAAQQIADRLGCCRSVVYKVLNRYADRGREGLLDQRRVSHRRIADSAYDRVVKELVEGSPQDYGYPRPTWTRELLILVALEQTGIRISLTSMTRVLKRIRARRGRPKPIVLCPLSNRQQRRRLRKIQKLLEQLPPDEVAFYSDEVDIHLNPKIGLDWMNRGQQKQVVTPGVNAKAYVAGALDARDGTVVWVGAPFKNSTLFVQLLEELCHRYPQASRIHLILDNYGIHHSHETKRAVRRLQRIRLHFLPPYCPDHNRIERLWEELHANVTRNHRHTNLLDLCAAVAAWLNAASPWPARLHEAQQSTTGAPFTLPTAA